MIPPLWPWKVIMLPARGPRPKLKGETVLSMRLMDDVEIPQVAQTYGPSWHFFNRFQNQSFQNAQVGTARPQLTLRPVAPASSAPQGSYADYVTRDVASVSTAGSLPGMPVFVLNTGSVLAVSAYGYQDSRISYTLASGGTGVITSDEIDWTTTTRINNQRGVRLSLHSGRAPAATPGL